MLWVGDYFSASLDPTIFAAVPYASDGLRSCRVRNRYSRPVRCGFGRLDNCPVPGGAKLLTPDELLAIADREVPGWTQLSLIPAAALDADNRTGTATLSAKAPGRGPSFFPVSVQVNPYSGEVLDVHSWDDLGGGTRFLAWSRWLHKGEAFGRTGQIVAGLACFAMLVLIYTGWALAIGRLLRYWQSPRKITE